MGLKKQPSTIVCDADGSCGNHNLRGLAPSLYRTKIEREQLEHLNTVNRIGGIVKICAFFSFYYNNTNKKRLSKMTTEIYC